MNGRREGMELIYNAHNNGVFSVMPVVVDHVLAEMANKASEAVYNGYTSCPLITRYGKAMLIEFDYDGKLVPSFPFIEPLEELWVSWLIDEKLLHGTYRAMLRGHA